MIGFERDYDRLLSDMITRRTAPAVMFGKTGAGITLNQGQLYTASPVYEIYRRLEGEGAAVKYTAGAMAPIDPKYTEITYEQGERVKKQLDKALREADSACEFEYQGSVTSDLHIKSHSDIDLLAITTKFSMLEYPQIPANPYRGDPIGDLRTVRSTSLECLQEQFPAAEVDSSGGKSIAISGGSLRRKIDVVPANWFNTNDYARSLAKRFRAVQVLDVKSGERIVNKPFLHNYNIAIRDGNTRGGVRKVIRLMKSLKYDSGNVSLSSFDITAIGYNMPEHLLLTFPGEEIPLLVRLKGYLDVLATDADMRGQILVPDQSRKVFDEGYATLDGLNELQIEVDDLVYAVSRNLRRPFSKLAEARMSY